MVVAVEAVVTSGWIYGFSGLFSNRLLQSTLFHQVSELGWLLHFNYFVDILFVFCNYILQIFISKVIINFSIKGKFEKL